MRVLVTGGAGDAGKLYENYWEGAALEREKRNYYKRLYGSVAARISVPKESRVLDVGGGNGATAKRFVSSAM